MVLLYSQLLAIFPVTPLNDLLSSNSYVKQRRFFKVFSSWNAEKRAEKWY